VRVGVDMQLAYICRVLLSDVQARPCLGAAPGALHGGWIQTRSELMCFLAVQARAQSMTGNEQGLHATDG
jgi:hypothetical protein